MGNGPLRSDRAAGVALGGATGDALGAGYEFGPPLAPDAVVAMTGGGPFGWEPGEWTDDTQMASAVLAPIAAGSNSDHLVDAVAAGFLAWFESDPPDVGGQTRRSLLRAQGEPSALAAAAAAVHAESPDAAGNGSLMRTGPLGLIPAATRQDRAALVAAVSDLTHAHSDCAAACVLWCDAIHRLLDLPAGPPTSGWIDHCRAGLDLLPDTERDRWAELLDSVEGADPEAFAARNGWVVDAFRQALAVLRTTPVPKGPWASLHLRNALDTAVRGGGDTDTVAAITGALAGAAWGATAVPLTWQLLLHGTAVDRRDVSVANGSALAALARVASTSGKADAQGWPTGKSMLGYYRSHFPGVPRIVDIDDHLSVGNVHALDEVDADVVVSLCRVGTTDGPPTARRIQVGLLDSNHPEDNPNLVPLLDDVARLVDEAAARGERIYLHCVQAEHRTPAALAAVLVARGQPPDHAATEAEAVTGGALLPVFRQALVELAVDRDRNDALRMDGQDDDSP